MRNAKERLGPVPRGDDDEIAGAGAARPGLPAVPPAPSPRSAP